MADRCASRHRTRSSKRSDEALLLVERPEPGVALLTLNQPADAQQPVARHDRGAYRPRSRTLPADPRCPRRLCSRRTGRRSRPGTTSRSLRRIAPTLTAVTASTPRRCVPAALLMQSIVACPKPVIAAVQGTATAAGCQLVATCDLAVAAAKREVRDARRQHRALLLDAHGGAVAQRVAQAGDGDAAARRDAVGGCGARLRSRQSRRAGGPRARRSAGHGAPDRVQVRRDGRYRQGGLLPPTRDGRCARPTTMRRASWSRT